MFDQQEDQTCLNFTDIRSSKRQFYPLLSFTIFAVLHRPFHHLSLQSRTPIGTPGKWHIFQLLLTQFQNRVNLVDWYAVIHRTSSTAVLQCHEVVLVT